jgi:hypothetical protein
MAQGRGAGEVQGVVRVIGHEQKEGFLHGVLRLPAHDTPFSRQKRRLDGFIDSNVPHAVDIPTGLNMTAIPERWLVV